MTHAPLKLKRVWTQEVDGGYIIKGLPSNGKDIVYLRRMFRSQYDFVQEEGLATVFCEKKACMHSWAIENSIKRGKCNTYLLTDNRTRANLLFIMLVKGNQYAGIFDRAEKAEQAVEAYIQEHGSDAATYIEVTEQINRFVQLA